MKTSTAISNTDDVIDSHDVIARIQELEEELEAYYSDEFEEANDLWEAWLDDPDADVSIEPQKPPDPDEWIGDVAADPQHAQYDEAYELTSLRNLADQLGAKALGQHGDLLVREDYFTEHIKELIKDCYEMPKEMESGNWPWNNMTMDWEGAAEEAKSDYTEADFDGVTYLMRA